MSEFWIGILNGVVELWTPVGIRRDAARISMPVFVAACYSELVLETLELAQAKMKRRNSYAIDKMHKTTHLYAIGLLYTALNSTTAYDISNASESVCRLRSARFSDQKGTTICCLNHENADERRVFKFCTAKADLITNSMAYLPIFRKWRRFILSAQNSYFIAHEIFSTA